MTPYLLGLCGGSASGKTSILDRLMTNLPSHMVTLISQDNYYKDSEFQRVEEDGTINFDHPDSVDLVLLEQHLSELYAGNPVNVREYYFNNPEKAGVVNMITYAPAPIIILEGMFIFHNAGIRNLLNLKVFVEAEEHIKLIRRIKRDGIQRGYALNEVLHQYEKNVMPMYRRYVEPYKFDADFILQNNEDFSEAADVLVNHIRIKLVGEGFYNS